MMSQLSLVHGGARTPAEFKPQPPLLRPSTQRPGELADLVALDLGGRLRERLTTLARNAHLPLPLFAVIAVEAERVLLEIAAPLEVTPEVVAALLDEAATVAGNAQFEPRPARALRAYARALTSHDYRGDERGPFRLVVPDRLRARWSLDAQASGLTVEAWIAERLERTQRGRERWEACAAFEGRTLAEWAALQALWRLRRSNS